MHHLLYYERTKWLMNRGTLSLVAIGLLGCSAGPTPVLSPASPPEPQTSSPQPAFEVIVEPLKPGLVGKIEHEVGPLDWWAREILEANYTQAPSRHVRLQSMRRLDARGREIARAFGLDSSLTARALYSAGADKLIVRPMPDGSVPDEVHMAHELWHALYDNEGTKGLIFSEGFEGPSETEIDAFVTARRSQPAFVALREEMVLASHYSNVGQMHMQYMRQGVNLFKESRGKFQRVQSLVRHDYVREHCPAAEFDEMAGEQRRLIGRAQDLRRHLREQATGLQAANGSKGMGAYVAALRPHVAALPGHVRATEPFYSLRVEVDALVARATAAEKRAFAEHIQSLRQGASPQDLEGIKAIEEMRALAGAMGGLSGMGGITLDLGLTPRVSGKDLIALAQSQAPTEQVDRHVFSTNEFMARVIDGLYGVHLGSPDQQRFPSDRATREFLGRFKHRGRPLFTRGIARYELGLRMQADGRDSTDIAALPHATTVRYRGDLFDWPTNGYHILGTIPSMLDDD